LGNVARERGEFDKAEHLFREAIKIQCEAQNPRGIRWAQDMLSLTFVFAGKSTQARQISEEILVAFGHLGDIAVAGMYLGLASVEIHEGGYERARVQAETSLALSRKSRYRWGVAYSLFLQSCLVVVEAESKLDARAAPQAQNTGKARELYAEAQRLAQESVTIYREMGVRIWLGQPLAISVVVARGLGDVDQAQRRLCEALRVASDTGAFLSLMLTLSAAALVLVDVEERERAVELYALASRYPLVGKSRWFDDVFGRHLAAVVATLPPDVVAAAQERGRARDIDTTVAELLAELGA
jgi:tetratricopeptide (TPR) repeat protein